MGHYNFYRYRKSCEQQTLPETDNQINQERLTVYCVSQRDLSARLSIFYLALNGEFLALRKQRSR